MANQRGRKEGSVSKHGKKVEAKKKRRAFVSDLESSADREAVANELKNNARGRSQGHSKEEKRKEAAETWELGKKLGLTSVVNDDRMITEVETLDRSKGKGTEEAGSNSKVSIQ